MTDAPIALFTPQGAFTSVTSLPPSLPRKWPWKDLGILRTGEQNSKEFAQGRMARW